jgi:hypothetical protein
MMRSKLMVRRRRKRCGGPGSARSVQTRLPVKQQFDAIVAARNRSRTQHNEALTVADGLPMDPAIVQMDATARIRCFPSDGLRETGTKARMRPEAARVHRR